MRRLAVFCVSLGVLVAAAILFTSVLAGSASGIPPKKETCNGQAVGYFVPDDLSGTFAAADANGDQVVCVVVKDD